jgi:SPP1 gp7 family putative phage head morphogenesis protein
MATNNNYWKERALEVENNSRSTAEIGRKEIEKIFAVTYSRLKKEINYWWHRFAVNNSLTLSEAKKLMKSKELEELDWDVEEYIKKGIEAAIVTLPEVDKQLENASAKVHINRLTALKLQVLVIANEMFSDVNKTVKDCMRKVYEDAYYTTAYNIQNGIGVYSDFNRINDRVLEQVLQRPWAEDGSNFSERIWGKQRPKLVNKIHKDLVDCVSRGRNPNEYTEELAKEFKVGLNQANNLIVTEYNYFNERATQDCMKELDVEEYEILGTLDGATCATCGGLDGKHYPFKDAVIGINSPPFHPRCRCTTIPYFNDEFTQGEERAYRGEDGKTHYTKAKTYEEWKRKFVKEKGQDAWDLYEKNAKNEKVNKFAGEKYASAGENRFTSKSNSDTIKSIDVDDFELFASSKSNNILPEVSKVITDTIKEFENQGGMYISEAHFGEFYDAETGKPALFQVFPNAYGLTELNVNSKILGGKTLDEINELIKNTPVNIANSLEEAVVHECGHAKAYYQKAASEIEEMNKTIKNKGVKEISKIAGKDGAECIAEVEVLLYRGEEVPEKAMELYNEWTRGKSK